MPEDEINEIRKFEQILQGQNGEGKKAYEKIEKAYFEVFRKMDDYNKISIIKMLIYHHPDLAFKIFRKTTKSHIEKVIE